jgi:hypothetical protein
VNADSEKCPTSKANTAAVYLLPAYAIVRVMVTIQEATANAIAFALTSLGPERTRGLLLEEIESATEGGTEVWRITLSMPDRNPANALSAFNPRREYKTFTVVKSTGEVTSMKIREMSKA